MAVRDAQNLFTLWLTPLTTLYRTLTFSPLISEAVTFLNNFYMNGHVNKLSDWLTPLLNLSAGNFLFSNGHERGYIEGKGGLPYWGS